MARPDKGVLSGFSGKVGTVIGGNWKGISYMRSLPIKRKNRKLTPAQEIQQAKFTLGAMFLRSFAQLFLHSFQKETKQTGRNSALGSALRNAITGTYPDLGIDYSLVQVAKGSLKKPTDAAAESLEPGKITFSWRNDSGMGNAKADDKPILVAYCDEYKETWFSVDVATRADGEAELDVSMFSGKQVHTWLAFRSASGELVSDSCYTGVIEVD